MTTNPAAAQDPAASPPRTALTISDLARRTGVSTAVLRTWETRHDFPRPTRLESGHRRYAQRDVALVEEVLRRRDAGVRLEVAIAEVRARDEDAPAAPSVFATLRRTQPHLHPQALRKSTLIALSWAIEDECAARAQRPLLYGAFQNARFFGRSAARWTELARTARETTVFADLDGEAAQAHAPGVRLVHLPGDAPMRREWVVVCDAADHPACLSAWELPGQDGVRDADRLFESIWTLEPAAVREAARTCASLAAELDPDGPAPAQPATALLGSPSSQDLRAATTLFTRLMAYVDRLP
ncbi:MAG: DICT sensory domain-containing protein [Nocardioidaceae bacterium]